MVARTTNSTARLNSNTAIADRIGTALDRKNGGSFSDTATMSDRIISRAVEKLETKNVATRMKDMTPTSWSSLCVIVAHRFWLYTCYENVAISKGRARRLRDSAVG